MRIIVLLITFSLNALAINIVTTLPEFAWMATDVSKSTGQKFISR